MPSSGDSASTPDKDEEARPSASPSCGARTLFPSLHPPSNRPRPTQAVLTFSLTPGSAGRCVACGRNPVSAPIKLLCGHDICATHLAFFSSPASAPLGSRSMVPSVPSVTRTGSLISMPSEISTPDFGVLDNNEGSHPGPPIDPSAASGSLWAATTVPLAQDFKNELGPTPSQPADQPAAGTFNILKLSNHTTHRHKLSAQRNLAFTNDLGQSEDLPLDSRLSSPEVPSLSSTERALSPLHFSDLGEPNPPASPPLHLAYNRNTPVPDPYPLAPLDDEDVDMEEAQPRFMEDDGRNLNLALIQSVHDGPFIEEPDFEILNRDVPPPRLPTADEIFQLSRFGINHDDEDDTELAEWAEELLR
ncbi:hypothetical protein FRB90_008568, partial [Tulasnella sp. 427]